MSGVILALLAALSWGGGDFSGGLATRRASQFQVLALSALAGGVLLGLAGILAGESFPAVPDPLVAAAGGALGALGIAALYRGLASGSAALVAPVAAVIGAATPVIYSLLIEGAARQNQQVGFGIALIGLWVVSGTRQRSGRITGRGGLLALLAGLGFGGFFILIGLLSPGANYLNLLIARAASFLVAVAGLWHLRLPFPPLREHKISILAGLLDTGGNVFFLLASQRARLDVSVILASLYPAVTVLLARLISSETISTRQWVGVGICVLAMILILL